MSEVYLINMVFFWLIITIMKGQHQIQDRRQMQVRRWRSMSMPHTDENGFDVVLDGTGPYGGRSVSTSIH